jgi:hypothetical protein
MAAQIDAREIQGGEMGLGERHFLCRATRGEEELLGIDGGFVGEHAVLCNAAAVVRGTRGACALPEK